MIRWAISGMLASGFAVIIACCGGGGDVATNRPATTNSPVSTKSAAKPRVEVAEQPAVPQEEGQGETEKKAAAIQPAVTANVPERFREFLRGPAARQTLRLRSINPGDVGFLPDYNVFQVIDGTTALIRQFNDRTVDNLVMLTEHNTSGLVDGKSYEADAVCEVAGTTTYTTLLGGSKTIYKLRRIPDATIVTYANLLKIELEDQRRHAREVREKELQESEAAAAPKLAALRQRIEAAEETPLKEFREAFSEIADAHDDTPSGASARSESAAIGQLDFARKFLKAGNKSKARKWLERLQTEHPETLAAKRAAIALKDLGE